MRPENVKIPLCAVIDLTFQIFFVFLQTIMVGKIIEFPFEWWYYDLVWTNRNVKNAI